MFGLTVLKFLFSSNIKFLFFSWNPGTRGHSGLQLEKDSCSDFFFFFFNYLVWNEGILYYCLLPFVVLFLVCQIFFVTTFVHNPTFPLSSLNIVYFKLYSKCSQQSRAVKGHGFLCPSPWVSKQPEDLVKDHSFIFFFFFWGGGGSLWSKLDLKTCWLRGLDDHFFHSFSDGSLAAMTRRPIGCRCAFLQPFLGRGDVNNTDSKINK